MGYLKRLVLLFVLLGVTDISACKKNVRKIKTAASQQTARQDNLMNPNFEKEYPHISSSAKIDYPDVLILPLNVYMSPSCRTMFPDREGLTMAKEVLSYAKELFIDDSLSVKMMLVYEDSDIVPIDKEFEVQDIGEMENFIPEPRQGRAVILYLTSPLPDGWLGLAIERSICDENRRKSRSIIGWDTSSKLTAKTVVHEIGHTIGMSHDFTLPGPGWRDYECGPGETGVGLGNQLMNYNEPMENSWSQCSNDDFKIYYKRVALKKKFCLKKHDGSPCTNTLSVKGRHFANGIYKKSAYLHNNRVWYEHNEKKWCIFYGRHWQVDACNFVSENKNQYQGYGWSTSQFKCPGNIGPNWRYYSWVGSTNSGPVDTSIVISPFDLP